jgi:hypothetical protein
MIEETTWETQEEQELVFVQEHEHAGLPESTSVETKREETPLLEEGRTYALKEVATYLGLSEKDLYYATSAKHLTGTKNKQGRYQFTPEDVYRYARRYLGRLDLPKGDDEPEISETFVHVTVPEALPGDETRMSALLTAAPVSNGREEAPAGAAADVPAPSTFGRCARCQRLFTAKQDFHVVLLEDAPQTGVPTFGPVCRDGRCDPLLQKETKAQQEHIVHLVSVLEALRDREYELGREIDKIIHEYKIMMASER